MHFGKYIAGNRYGRLRRETSRINGLNVGRRRKENGKVR